MYMGHKETDVDDDGDEDDDDMMIPLGI